MSDAPEPSAVEGPRWTVAEVAAQLAAAGSQDTEALVERLRYWVGEAAMRNDLTDTDLDETLTAAADALAAARADVDAAQDAINRTNGYLRSAQIRCERAEDDNAALRADVDRLEIALAVERAEGPKVTEALQHAADVEAELRDAVVSNAALRADVDRLTGLHAEGCIQTVEAARQRIQAVRDLCASERGKHRAFVYIEEVLPLLGEQP